MESSRLIGMLRAQIPPHYSSLEQTLAVFWAQLKIFATYRSWVIIETFNTLVSIAMYYFIGLLVPPSKLASTGYGTSYLAFSLVGVAFANYLWICITRLSHSIQAEIRLGTFETIASSPISLTPYILGQAIRGFFVGGYYMVGSILVGTLIFKARLHFEPLTVLSTFMIILLMVAVHMGIGVLAAGIILVYKQADPLTFIFSMITEFFAGALFPLQLLSGYPPLEFLARFMPYTYSLDALRRTLLLGQNLLDAKVITDIGVLVLYALIMIPLSLAAFHRGFERVREEGTTSVY